MIGGIATHALRRMMEQDSGSLINTSSGAQAGSAFRGAYSAARPGLRNTLAPVILNDEDRLRAIDEGRA